MKPHRRHSPESVTAILAGDKFPWTTLFLCSSAMSLIIVERPYSITSGSIYFNKFYYGYENVPVY